MNTTIFLFGFAAGLILVSTTRFAAAGLSFRRQRAIAKRRRTGDIRHLRQAAEIARLNSELQVSQGASTALAWRVMEVAEVVEESEDCRSFYLVDPYRQPLPDFRPGQYLMVRPALAGAYQATRCYSISSSPNERYWRITVKRQECEPNERTKNNGGLSKWLHQTIQAGDCLLIGGPSGQFFLPRDSQRPLVLLAAGVGITPMTSMLRWSLEHTPHRPVALLYQVKDFSHWPLGSSLHAWQADFGNCRISTFLSREDERNITEAQATLPGKFVAGKFDSSDAARALADCPDPEFYMCGPDGWMKAIREGLIDSGIAEERVHWESFGGTGAQPIAAVGPTTAIDVRFDHSDVDTAWSDPEQSVWELARESGVDLPSGCLSGVCGCCRVRVLEGEVTYDREISIELAPNECLTCIARPKTALKVDA